MNRKIEFRGKEIKTGKWIYGYLSFFYVDGRNENGFIHTDKARIYSQDDAIAYDVLAETVGQFIGLKDKNKIKVYEKDIVECKYGIGQIVYEEGKFILGGKDYPKGMDISIRLSEIQLEVIGNICENKELLK